MATKTLKMVFNMPAGGTFTQSLADPKDDITKTQCQSYMNEAISDELFVIGGASPDSIKEMYIHVVDDIELSD